MTTLISKVLKPINNIAETKTCSNEDDGIDMSTGIKDLGSSLSSPVDSSIIANDFSPSGELPEDDSNKIGAVVSDLDSNDDITQDEIVLDTFKLVYNTKYGNVRLISDLTGTTIDYPTKDEDNDENEDNLIDDSNRAAYNEFKKSFT